MSQEQFTKDELYELNDALSEVIDRMVKQGQTKTEIEYNSLAVMWQVQKKVTRALLGTDDTPGIQDAAPVIEAAIAKPKQLDRDHAYM